MKLCDVYYTGPMRSHMRRGPSGERYHFRRTTDGPQPTSVSSLEDAQALAENDVFRVEWTAQGELAQSVGTKAKSAASVLSDLSYRQKQKLVSALGADVKGNAPEDELTSALEPAVEEMVRNIEIE